MKRVLLLCATPYQYIVAERVLAENYKDAEVTLAMGDTSPNAEKLVERLRKEDRFAEVLFWKIKGVFSFSQTRKLLNVVSGEKKSFEYVRGIEGLDKDYDVFLYSNISPAVQHIGTVLLSRNPGLKAEMFEDGFTTYSDYTGNFILDRRFIKMRLNSFFPHTSALYVFNPDILNWEPPFEVKRITPDFSGEILERVNRVFAFSDFKDDYGKKIIFFEESYFADNREPDDVEIVEDIARIAGKENIFIKIHPRNPVNRFAELGYATNTDTSVPWEIILINGDFENSIFMTLASNAAMNPYFLFGKKTPAFLLYKYTSKPEALHQDIVDFDDKLCSRYPEVFRIPSDKEELRSELNKVL